MTTPTTLLPRLVRVLLSRDADLASSLERGHDLAGRFPRRPTLSRRRRPTGWDAFRRTQRDYDGCADPDDG